jgi:hypothetical protein
MLTGDRLETGGSKLEALLTVSDFFEIRASSLLPQAYTCLGCPAGCLLFNVLSDKNRLGACNA